MAKKLSLLIASLSVVAFAVPAFASAAPAVTDGGSLLAPGKSIQARNVLSASTQTSLGKIQCSIFRITTELTANTGSTFRAVGKGAGTSSGCAIGVLPLTVTDITLTELHSSVSGSGTINITFVADLPGGVVCHFSSPSMPFSYTTGSFFGKVFNGDLVGTPAACEPGLFNIDFEFATVGGGLVILD